MVDVVVEWVVVGVWFGRNWVKKWRWLEFC